MNANQTVVTIATVFAALGLWLLLPRAGRPGRMAGAVLAAIAAGLFFAEVPRLGTWMADSLFFVIAGVTLVAATATITVRNPVYAALWFGLMLVGVAGLFLFQGAQFLAAATIVVYAGAILVTFLFTLMLAQPEGRAPYDRISWEALLSATSGAMIVGVLSLTVAGVFAYGDGLPTRGADRTANVLVEEHVVRLGMELFGPHLIAVQVAGVLLLAALVGAAVIVARAGGPLVVPAPEKRDSAHRGPATPTGGVPPRAREV